MKLNRYTLPGIIISLLAFPSYATTTVTSFEALKAVLNELSDSNVILDMAGNNTTSSANINIAKDQNVTLHNINKWKNPASDNTVASERLMINNGHLTLKNVNISENDLYVTSGSKGGGGVLQNNGTIDTIINSTFNNNHVGSIPKNDLWGGLITNLENANIKLIKDSFFTDNYFDTGQSAPHGAIIYNTSTINEINNVVFQNNTMVAQKNFKGGAHGTAIDNNQYSVIELITNSKFINNKSYKPGDAIPEGHASGSAINNYNIIKTISNSLFMNNVVESDGIVAQTMGGAIKNLYATSNGAIGLIEEIKNSKFIQNKSIHNEGIAYGGAIATGKPGQNPARMNNMQNLLFQDNFAIGSLDDDTQSAALGGAIYNSGIIENLSGNFINNFAKNKSGKSGAQGGAIYNEGQNANINKVDVEFNGNYAIAPDGFAQGGAIYNNATIGFDGSEFYNNYATGNTDSTNGGAIWNSGTINFTNNNEFKNNNIIVAGIKSGNDIYNSGEINLLENAKLDITGGITGESGSINMGQNSFININNTTISGNNITLSDGATIAMQISQTTTPSLQFNGGKISGDITLNGTNTLLLDIFINNLGKNNLIEYTFANTVDATNGHWDLQTTDNMLYNTSIDLDDTTNNKIILSYGLKSAEDISATTGLDKNKTNVLLSLINTPSSNQGFNSLQSDISLAAQSGHDINNDISTIIGKPSASILSIQSTSNLITNTISNHIYKHTPKNHGRSGGENHITSPNIWMTGLYQKAKNTDGLNINTDNYGSLIGIDIPLLNDLTMGIGYVFSYSDTKGSNLDINSDTHTVFAYAQYNQDKWFSDLELMYSYTNFDQTKHVLTNTISGNIGANTYGAILNIGHNFDISTQEHDIALSPSMGIRYYSINQDSYTDSIGVKYKETNTNTLTGLVGLRITANNQFGNNKIQQRAYLNTTYDMLDTDINITMRLPNNNTISANDKTDTGLGFEIGYGISAYLTEAFQIGLNYEFNKKTNYYSHSGIIDLKYLF